MSMRRRILDGFEQLTEQLNLQELTMDELANYVGISKKTIYNHFQSKYDLIDTYKIRFIEQSTKEAEGIVKNSEMGFAEKINKLLVIGYSGIAKGRSLNLNRLDEGQNVHIAGITSELRGMILEIIQSVVNEAVEAGLLNEQINPSELTHVLLNIVEGTLISTEGAYETYSPASILSHSLQYLFRGILSEKGARELESVTSFV